MFHLSLFKYFEELIVNVVAVFGVFNEVAVELA